MVEDTRTLVLWAIRRTLGVSVAFLLFYLAAPTLWDVPPLTAPGVLSILGVVLVGVLLGVVISYFWPLPAKTGLARAIRTAIFSIPAFGFGMAVHITVGGPSPPRAYWLIFAVATLLGSVYFTEDAEEDGSDSVSDADGDDVAEAVADD